MEGVQSASPMRISDPFVGGHGGSRKRGGVTLKTIMCLFLKKHLNNNLNIINCVNLNPTIPPLKKNSLSPRQRILGDIVGVKINAIYNV